MLMKRELVKWKVKPRKCPPTLLSLLPDVAAFFFLEKLL
jgi:hypothetical protein